MPFNIFQATFQLTFTLYLGNYILHLDSIFHLCPHKFTSPKKILVCVNLLHHHVAYNFIFGWMVPRDKTKKKLCGYY